MKKVEANKVVGINSAEIYGKAYQVVTPKKKYEVGYLISKPRNADKEVEIFTLSSSTSKGGPSTKLRVTHSKRKAIQAFPHIKNTVRAVLRRRPSRLGRQREVIKRGRRLITRRNIG